MTVENSSGDAARLRAFAEPLGRAIIAAAAGLPPAERQEAARDMRLQHALSWEWVVAQTQAEAWESLPNATLATLIVSGCHLYQWGVEHAREHPYDSDEPAAALLALVNVGRSLLVWCEQPRGPLDR